MKKIFLMLILVLVAVCGYVVAGPYIAVSAIKTGIAENDAEALERHIDFPVLRQNIKAQLTAAMAKEAEQTESGNFFSALMHGIKAKLVEGMVDSFVTPQGLANAMEGKKTVSAGESAAEAPAADSSAAEKTDLFKDARFSYDSFNNFSIWVPNENGTETRFVLKRMGLSWKLVDVVLNSQSF